MLGLLLIEPFTAFVETVLAGAPPGRQLANAHVLFNLIGVGLIAGFVPFIADRLEQWLPDARPKTASPTV